SAAGGETRRDRGRACPRGAARRQARRRVQGQWRRPPGQGPDGASAAWHGGRCRAAQRGRQQEEWSGTWSSLLSRYGKWKPGRCAASCKREHGRGKQDQEEGGQHNLSGKGDGERETAGKTAKRLAGTRERSAPPQAGGLGGPRGSGGP